MKRIYMIGRTVLPFLVIVLVWLSFSGDCLAQDSGNQGGNQPGGTGISQTITSTGNSYADKVKDEVENLVGELEDQIMQGLSDMIMGYISSLISEVLDASPLRSVEKLKDLLKDAYGKQQKLDYQQLKVDFAEQKANTEMSTSFTQYYSSLDLKKKGDAVLNKVQYIGTILNSPEFTADERAQFTDIASSIGDLSEISDEIKYVVNQGSTTAYMEEADRMKVLDDNDQRIQQRFKQASLLANKLMMVLRYRASDSSRSSLYDAYVGAKGDASAPRVRIARPVGN